MTGKHRCRAPACFPYAKMKRSRNIEGSRLCRLDISIIRVRHKTRTKTRRLLSANPLATVRLQHHQQWTRMYSTSIFPCQFAAQHCAASSRQRKSENEMIPARSKWSRTKALLKIMVKVSLEGLTPHCLEPAQRISHCAISFGSSGSGEASPSSEEKTENLNTQRVKGRKDARTRLHCNIVRASYFQGCRETRGVSWP